jgi:hypothetical protein
MSTSRLCEAVRRILMKLNCFALPVGPCSTRRARRVGGLRLALVLIVIIVCGLVTSAARAGNANQRRFVVYVEATGTDVANVRGRLNSSIPANVTSLDPTGFQTALRSGGATESIGASYGNAAERPRMLARIRLATEAIGADVAVIALSFEAAKTRVMRILVVRPEAESPDLDQVVTLDAAKAGTDASKVEGVLRQILENLAVHPEADIAEPMPAPVTSPAVAQNPQPQPLVTDANPWLLTPAPSWLVAGFYGAFDFHAAAGRGVNQYRSADGGLNPGFSALPIAVLRGRLGERVRYQGFFSFGFSNSSGPNQSYRFDGGILDTWVNFKVDRLLQLRLGQTNVPFGIEGFRPFVYNDFRDRSRLSQAAVNSQKDLGLLVFGFPGSFAYAAGIFNNEGRSREPVDAQLAAVGHLMYIYHPKERFRFNLGISGKQSATDPASTFSPVRLAGLQSPGGYAFWSNTYTVSSPTPAQVYVLPAGRERVIGADFAIIEGPLSVDVEGMYLNYGRREATQTAVDTINTLRSGSLTGFDYYVTFNYWFTRGEAIQSTRDVPSLDREGFESTGAADFRPSIALRVRWEQTFFNYDSLSHSSPDTPRGLIDFYTRRIQANSIQLLVPIWFTRRIAILPEYDFTFFPASEIIVPGPVDTQSIVGRRLNNQALAPGAVIPGERGTLVPPGTPASADRGNPNYFNPPDIGARGLHEFLFRVALWFP